jgi:hypothetical protein
MNIDQAKFSTAIRLGGYSTMYLATKSGLTARRINQLKANGGNTNDLSAKALAKVLKVSIDDIKGEG